MLFFTTREQLIYERFVSRMTLRRSLNFIKAEYSVATFSRYFYNYRIKKKIELSNFLRWFVVDSEKKKRSRDVLYLEDFPLYDSVDKRSIIDMSKN